MSEILKEKLEAKIKVLKGKYFYQDRCRLPRKLYYHAMSGEIENNRKIEALKLALKVVNGEKISPYELYTFYFNSMPEGRKDDNIIHELQFNPCCQVCLMRKAFEEIITTMCPIAKKQILKFELKY